MFQEEEQIAIASHFENTTTSIKTSDCIWIRCCNDKTAKRDSVWCGVMPAGKKYDESIESHVKLEDFEIPEIIDIIQPKIDFLKAQTNDKTPYKINTVQFIDYRPPSWKTVHFDGRYLTNYEQLFGLTLNKGKKW